MARLAETERDFQNKVIDLARLYGWRVAHFRPAPMRRSAGWVTPMQGDPGFPDLVLARAGRVIFAELKAETGRISTDQAEWFSALSPMPGAGDPSHDVFIWRPRDFPAIAELLSDGKAHAQ